MLFRRTLACSFCGKTAKQVAKLVAGRRGYICNSCAAEAHRIMTDGSSHQTRRAPQPSTNAWRRFAARVKRLSRFDQSFDTADAR